MRPAVVMFNDEEDILAQQLLTQQAAYQEWEETMEAAVAEAGQHGVLLELGCGIRVPAVRMECEEVHRDTLCRIRQAGRESRGSLLHVRINPDYPILTYRRDGIGAWGSEGGYEAAPAGIRPGEEAKEGDPELEEEAHHHWAQSTLPLRAGALQAVSAIDTAMRG